MIPGHYGPSDTREQTDVCDHSRKVWLFRTLCPLRKALDKSHCMMVLGALPFLNSYSETYRAVGSSTLLVSMFAHGGLPGAVIHCSYPEMCISGI